MKLKNLEDALHMSPFAPFIIHIDGKNILIGVDQIEFLTTLPRRKPAKR